MRMNLSKARLFSTIIGVILTFSSLGLLATSAENNHPESTRPFISPTVPVTIGSKTIKATLANTNPTRIQGLLGWEQIREDQGMLLDFIRPGRFAIHMQGMKFPIDALWVDSAGVIKLIYSQIQPNSGIIYPSMFEVRYCLEIAPGFCRKYGIKEGQKVILGN